MLSIRLGWERARAGRAIAIKLTVHIIQLVNTFHSAAESYRQRWIAPSIRDSIESHPVVVLTGARQVGKSTLLRSETPFRDWPYITFDDPEAMRQAEDDPAGLWVGKPAIVLDEVQRVPGILLAGLLYFFVKEPPKGRFDPEGVSLETPTLSTVIKTLLGKKTFIYIALGSGFLAFGSYGVGNFLPSFLQRVHGVEVSKAGYLLGIAFGLGGGIGTFLGGYLADRLRTRDMRWYIWLPLAAAVLALIPFSIYLFSANLNVVVWMLFMTSVLFGIYFGPTIAVSHSLVNARLRSFISAVLFLVLNFIGLGLGPLTVGLLSDFLTPEFGDLSLRWAFSCIFVSQALAVLFFALASRDYLKDLKGMTP